jgi:hypothetical protein
MRIRAIAARMRLGQIIALAAVAAFGVPGSAWADEIVNTLDASSDGAREALALTVPTAGGTTIFVAPTNGDGKSGCNLQGTAASVTFAVASSDGSVATVSPSSLTFGSCGDTRAITVTPVGQGSADITFTESANSSAGSWDATPANFAVNVAGGPVASNSAPEVVGDIAGETVVSEGDAGTYGITASDPDGDPLTYKWSVTGGNAFIDGSDSDSGVELRFTDGPSSVSLAIEISDDHGHTVARSLSIIEHNVAPTVTVSGPLSADEGDTVNYTYAVSDPGDDAQTISESCGQATKSAAATGFDCTFPDNGSYSVGVSANDGDDIGEDTETVAVANVAPTIVDWLLSGTDGVACLSGNTVSVSFNVTDPADEAHDPITGSAFGAFTGRTVSQSRTFAAGPWSLTATAEDGDGGSDTRTVGGAFKYSTTGGFPLAPINADGTSNFKLGSTIPVKLRVVDCNGQPVGGLTPQVSLARTGAAEAGAVNEPVDTYSQPDDGKTMRYDAASGQYIYNLSTKKSVFAAGGPLSLGRYTLSVGGSLIASPPSVTFDMLK